MSDYILYYRVVALMLIVKNQTHSVLMVYKIPDVQCLQKQSGNIRTLSQIFSAKRIKIQGSFISTEL